MLLLSFADFFFKINFVKKFFQENYQNVKQFGSRSGSKLFAKVISRQQKRNFKFDASKERVNKITGYMCCQLNLESICTVDLECIVEHI